MSAGNRSKAKGTREEKRQRDMLASYGFTVDRLAEEGLYDMGDYIVRLAYDVVGEAKNNAALNIHETVAKAKRKAPHNLSFVWWKRTKRKDGNKNMTPVGKPIVCMDEDQFCILLQYAKAGMLLEANVGKIER